MKLETNGRKFEKFTNTCKLNNRLLNMPKKKSQEKLKNTLRQMKMKIQDTTTYSMQ